MAIQKSPIPSVPVCNESVGAKVLRSVWEYGKQTPQRPALISARDPNVFVTFHEFYTKVHSIRAFLLSRRFRNGQVAALVLPNSIEWVIFNIGVWAAGGAISGASALFTDFELERQFRDSQCTVVLTNEENLDKVLHASKSCERVNTVICVRAHSHRRLPGSVVDWDDAVAFRPSFEVDRVDPSQVAALPYSSGTTGSPKGVMLSHVNFGTMMNVSISHLEHQVMRKLDTNFDWRKETVILNLPFYHIFGFGTLIECLLTGMTGIILDKFEPILYLKAIERYRPRMLFIVPPIVIFLAKSPEVDKYDLTSLTFVMSGAAPAGKDLSEEFIARHKYVKLFSQGYGMTECGMASHFPTADQKEAYLGVGVILSNFEQKVVDVSTGKELAFGEKGEVCVRGPTIMRGYLNRPEATAETIRDGWLHTGDIGYIAPDGRTFIVDRLKELIKVKGFQVPPAELEDLLLSHPLIKDVAVIGIPDTNKGELVRAYVVKRSDALTEEDVIKFVAHKVSSYKRITGGVRFVKEIPKSAAGKILRRFLREEAAKEAKATKSKI